MENENQVVSVFEEIVRATVGPERYDRETARRKELRERYEEHEFFTYELYILNRLKSNEVMRTITLQREWEGIYCEDEFCFETVYGHLCEGNLIDNFTEENGWDEVHYTCFTPKGKKLLEAFLGDNGI